MNADFLEEAFKKNGFINLSDFTIDVNQEDLEECCSKSGLFKKAGFDEMGWGLFVKENVIVKLEQAEETTYNSYHFAIIADFIRQELIRNKISFSFETVFSHPSKLDLIDLAQLNGYKVYLYFIGTETPIMNLERVKDRVKKGGHPVEEEKIRGRYFLTMELLVEMIKKANETYLWDNSGIKHQYIGNVKKGIIEFEQATIPSWIYTFILDKLKL
ncbi:zeta toxin family protein [Pedobacter sp. Du54]|uniref:zeta toxin family protein n=1 Tax=Pedobacter anseongensis TaxID=3133439 RepID=UPI0030B5257C